MIRFKQKGNFSKLTGFLEHAVETVHLGMLDKYGKKGVELLAAATPKDTGLTASSWYYEIENRKGLAIIRFCNSNLADDWFPVAIMLQYGHATKNGGWVQGVDYINPVIQPLFEEIAKEAWKEVTKS